MRRTLMLLPLMLAGCAAAPAPGPVPRGPACEASGGQAFVGKLATAESGAAILAATHSNVLRWAAPGMMMTMEFRADRVTVRYGPDRIIEAVNCG